MASPPSHRIGANGTLAVTIATSPQSNERLHVANADQRTSTQLETVEDREFKRPAIDSNDGNHPIRTAANPPVGSQVVAENGLSLVAVNIHSPRDLSQRAASSAW
jgi:hypothetical protein